MLKSVKLLSDEQLKLNANDDQDAYQDENDNEDAPSTSHFVTSKCTLDQEIASDIDWDNDEAAAPLICNVEILLFDSLTTLNNIESSNRAICSAVRCAAHSLRLAVDDALKQTTLRGSIEKARKVCKISKNPSTMVILRKGWGPLV